MSKNENHLIMVVIGIQETLLVIFPTLLAAPLMSKRILAKRKLNSCLGRFEHTTIQFQSKWTTKSTNSCFL